MPSQEETLPSLPARYDEFIRHVAGNPQVPVHDLLEPYKVMDAKLRHIFAQQPDHPAVNQPTVVPVFGENEQDLRIRARNLDKETEEERQRYIMPLDQDRRRPDGSPAVVQSLKEFQKNFAVFTESSLSEMDWSNVVVAGSAALTPLLPVPHEFAANKRSLRQYYHEKIAPASDVDIFLYGLTDEQAKEKIIQIEQHVRDSVLSETTTVRTKNAITIVSEYPTRHIQIVLRVYRSISEMLTGFDVDCSCVAYDGSQVWASPRALAACMTQINQIDLTRRSPSYENRLSKYAHRGFEIYCGQLLQRELVNPTIFERSFQRVVGLARLLVLERLPKKGDREAYAERRRSERGRPQTFTQQQWSANGNIKNEHEDEVADWVYDDEVSDYHTFTLPYGPKYHARKIEKLLYKKDLLLNAEWNRKKEREVHLHRHPAFFGSAQDAMRDCCGFCPVPETPEEKDVAKEEGKRYVSGPVTFLKDNPGRQAIGSFNPITDMDWTEMAYVANTESLCNAIVDMDLARVQYWLAQDDVNPNHRDWTGRAPLHLACICSSLEIVQCLIDHGARIVARLADGRTAVHLAAMRGDAAMVAALLRKSEANREEACNREERSRALLVSDQQDILNLDQNLRVPEHLEQVDTPDEEDNDCTDVTTQDSYVNIKHPVGEPASVTTNIKYLLSETLPEEAEEDDPDVYDINVCAWDMPASALHLAIINGHVNVVKTLVEEFGANVLLPVKLGGWNNATRATILPLVMATLLPVKAAKSMVVALINLGCSAAQADMGTITALHYFTTAGQELLQCLINMDKAGALRALKHVIVTSSSYSVSDVATPLTSAIRMRDKASVLELLDAGAPRSIDLTSYWRSLGDKSSYMMETMQKSLDQQCQSPAIVASENEMPSLVLPLLSKDADINFANKWEEGYGDNRTLKGRSVLDSVRGMIKSMKQYLNGSTEEKRSPLNSFKDSDLTECLKDVTPGSYSHWSLQRQVDHTKLYLEKVNENRENDDYKPKINPQQQRSIEKDAAVRGLLEEYTLLEAELVKRGAKTFWEIHGLEVDDADTPDKPAIRLQAQDNSQPSLRLKFEDTDATGDKREAAYHSLFEACWNGDMDTITELTTTIWDNENAPLKVAVVDRNGFSTFDIAIIRGHLTAAELILDITSRQHAFKLQADKERFSKQAADDNEDDSADEEDDDAISIMTEVIDNRITVDDIGMIPAQAEGTISALELLARYCPVSHFVEELREKTSSDIKKGMRISPSDPLFGRDFERSFSSDGYGARTPSSVLQLAIYRDDIDLLSFLLKLHKKYLFEQLKETGKDSRPQYIGSPDTMLSYAMRLGRIRAAEELITCSGAGLPVESILEKYGKKTSNTVKPKYYKGLTVRGAKRQDWANAGRSSQRKSANRPKSLLLLATEESNVETVKWAASQAPERCYKDFISTHQDHPHVQKLKDLEYGLEKAIISWLGANRHLVAHCALFGKSPINVLRYLVNEDPSIIHQIARNGQTPLQLALALNRPDYQGSFTSETTAIEFLISAGSDQTTRDQHGNNLVHTILNPARHQRLPASEICRLLGFLDPEVLKDLFIQRSAQDSGSHLTPLALLLKETNPHEDCYEQISAVLSFSKGAELDIMNGDGDLLLHTEVRRGRSKIVNLMLQHRPELLYTENAVGRTPHEIAREALLAEMLSNPPRVRGVGQDLYWRSTTQIVNTVNKPISDFVDPPSESKSDKKLTWDVCASFADKDGLSKKRKLVSLLDANEVARRLANENTRQRKIARMSEGKAETKDVGEEVLQDPVDVRLADMQCC